MGRTEDVTFSPDDRRLAIAGFGRDKVFLLDIVIAEDHGRRVSISVTGMTELSSPGLHEPHGLRFLDDSTIVIANRGGEATILELPGPSPGLRSVRVVPAGRIKSDDADGLESPGSVCVTDIAPELHEILVCNNYANNVSRHLVDARDRYRVLHSEVVLAAGLDIPDGVASSPDHRWLAVSNHNTHRVLVFRNDPSLRPSSVADGSLGPVRYPHGLRFTPDGRHLFMADAGAPYVHVFARGGDDWTGEREPVSTIEVMDDECFLRGHHNPEEGGPKGLDLDSSARVLVVTSEHQPFAVFDLREVFPDVGCGSAGRDHAAESVRTVEAARAVIVRESGRTGALEVLVDELRSGMSALETTVTGLAEEVDGLESELARVRADLIAARAGAEHQRLVADDRAEQLLALRESTSWRATAPLRRLGAALRLGAASLTTTAARRASPTSAAR
jgi:hypothetical protein